MAAPTGQRWMPQPLARPRADLPPPDVLRGLVDDQGRLAVRVTPGARGESIMTEGGRVTVKVRAKPEDGKATTAVADLLAQALGIAASRVQLLRGATSRDKLFSVQL